MPYESVTCTAQPIEHASPFGPFRRPLDGDPIEAALVQTMQRLIQDGRVGGGIGRHLLRVVGGMRLCEPQVSPPASRRQGSRIYQEKWSDRTVVLVVQTR